jgi:hypothetical protein
MAKNNISHTELEVDGLSCHPVEQIKNSPSSQDSAKNLSYFVCILRFMLRVYHLTTDQMQLVVPISCPHHIVTGLLKHRSLGMFVQILDK